MRALGLKLNTYVRSISVINNNIEKLLLNTMLSAFVGLSLLYLLFLAVMVGNILERKSLEAESRTIAAEVGDLESTYFSKSENIDAKLSHSLGFLEVKAIFATRKPLGFLPDNSATRDYDL